MHYVTDVFVNLMVIFSLLSSRFVSSGIVDTIISFVIAAYIFKGSWRVGKSAFDNLMDKEMPDSEREKIKECVLSNPNARGMHDLRTRVSGINKFIQFHVELDSDISLKSANLIAHEIETQLEILFPNSEVIVHQDHEKDENSD